MLLKFLIGLVALATMAAGAALAADIGPKADVAAVRTAQLQRAPHEHIPEVHVVGDYAP